MTIKEKVNDLLAVSPNRGSSSWFVDLFIEWLIIFNVVAVVLETVNPLYEDYQRFFHLFDLFSVIIFTVEYILRVWSANMIAKYKRVFWGNLKYACTPIAIIDLIAILPFYLPLFGIDLRFVRILRLLRLFRLFKLARYSRAIITIRNVAVAKKEELTVSIIFTFILLLFSSTLMYYVEHEVQPDKFASIPDAMWWGIATLTTVGYGDLYPITPLGKILGGFIAILGIGLFAIPSGILASGFSKAFDKKAITKCPKCEHQFHPHQDHLH